MSVTLKETLKKQGFESELPGTINLKTQKCAEGNKENALCAPL